MDIGISLRKFSSPSTIIPYHMHLILCLCLCSHDPAYTVLSQQEATRAALSRASGPSLGSICAASLTINCLQFALFVLRWARRVTTPPQLLFLAPLHPLSFLGGVIARFEAAFSTYALTYVGITGEGFWVSAQRSREFVGGKNHAPASGVDEDEDEDDETTMRRNRRRRGAAAPVRRISDCKCHYFHRTIVIVRNLLC